MTLKIEFHNFMFSIVQNLFCLGSVEEEAYEEAQEEAPKDEAEIQVTS